ncbi:unnamed protein product [Brachionus calyciflorus]|uniref:Lipid droplet-associated hydrolase n=1 Tax=Brachionus calyciflorus TaxID=104777 RepID=A0A813U0F2_9BILA|nr:unnamed protein product [Brachionus calyciflorus]
MSSVRYEICEIDPGHYIKVLKCHSEHNTKVDNFNKNLYVIIPGNPGIIEFYEHFAMELHKKTNDPVIGISHTGHLYHETIRTWKPKKVINQVMDKVKYIEKHLGDEYNYENIVLIGHSIGCYVILELLELLNKDHKRMVKKSFLLFPTIERMALTPNVYLISFMPQVFQKKLINIGFTSRHQSVNEDNILIDNIHDIILKMGTTFSCARSCFYMGADEMNVVKDLNKMALKNHLEKLYLYYGASDKWCPLDYYHDMRNLVDKLENKEINLHLDELGLDHAFVIYKKQCEIITNLVSDHITKS